MQGEASAACKFQSQVCFASISRLHCPLALLYIIPNKNVKPLHTQLGCSIVWGCIFAVAIAIVLAQRFSDSPQYDLSGGFDLIE